MPCWIACQLSSEFKLDDNLHQVSVRGASPDGNGYYVDGVKVLNTETVLRSRSINSLTIFKGHIPANYGDATGAIIAVETKSYFQLYHERSQAYSNTYY
jgi:hypothetical protein